MAGNSHPKRPLMDPDPDPSLPKKPRESIEIKPRPPVDKICPTHDIEFNLDNFFKTKLNPELDELVKSLEGLRILYENLENFSTTEKIPQTVQVNYTIRTKHVNSLKEKVSDERNRLKELREESKVVTRIKTSLELLLNKITKEKKLLENLKKNIHKKLNNQEQKYRTKIKRQTVNGDEFQRTLQILLRQRARSYKGAEVGIEVPGVGQLDDAVCLKTNEKKSRFFQMKHKTDKHKPITLAELFKLTIEDNNGGYDDNNEDEARRLQKTTLEEKKKSKEDPGLHLLMYFKSFCLIKENPKFEKIEIEEVTLITNRDIVLTTRGKDQEFRSLLVDTRRISDQDDECLDFGDMRAQKYGIDLETAKKKHFYTLLLKECSKYFFNKKDQATEIVDDFLKKIHIVVNYPDIRDLRKRTFNEVFREDIFSSLPTTVFESVMLQTEIKLLQQNKEFTTNEEWESVLNEIKKFIIAFKAVTLTDWKKKNVMSDTDFKISFEKLDELNEDVNHLIKGHHHQVLECTGENFKMNIIKILHILEGRFDGKVKFLFCGYDDLLTAVCLLEEFVVGDFSLLVVLCKNSTNVEKKLETDLIKALNNSSKKMIIVSNGENTFTSMKDLLTDKYLCKKYQHGYKCLTTECQEKLRSKQINFQMNKITLGELISDDLANIVVDDVCLYDIIDKNNGEVNVSDDCSFCSPGYSKEYYIPREFYQRSISFKTLKKYLPTNTFILTERNGMTIEEIKTVFTNNNISGKSVQMWENQPESNGMIYVRNSLSKDDLIYEIKINSSKNVHWLTMNDCENFFLIDSIDDQFIDQETLKKLLEKEEDLDTNSLGCIVILVGDSGAGKSTTLTSIANKIRQSCSSTWVARVTLTKACKTLENTNNFDSPEDAISCVYKMIVTCESQNTLDKHLLKEGLKRAYRGKFSLVLQLDGFNEINEALQEKLINLIKTLRDRCNVDQIWITTQNHDRVKLETNLNVSSYFLKPLNDEDQINLMACYLEKENKRIKSTLNLKNYSKQAIQEFKSCINDEEKRQFTGNALNLRMLADILLCNNFEMKFGNSLFDLYTIFVQKRFSVHRSKAELDHFASGDDERSEESVRDKLFESYVRNILQQFSAKTFFNHQTYKKLEKKQPGMNTYEQFKDIVGSSAESELSKLGLLIQKNHNFDFIHPSFAQFFFSEYLIKFISETNCKALDRFWVQFILTTDSFTSCRKFLDHALEKLENSNSEELKKSRNSLATSFATVLVQRKRNSAAPFKENLPYLSLFLLRWLSVNDTKRYVVKILKQDFTSNVDDVIRYITTTSTSKEKSVKLLINLYQNIK